jgi:hypothetical protein
MKEKWAIFIPTIVFVFVVSACSLKVEPTKVNNQANEITTPEISTPTETQIVADSVVEETQATNTPEPSNFPQKDIYAIGDYIRVGDDILLMMGWEEISAGPDFPVNYKYIGVDLILVNQSSEPKRYYPQLATLYDIDGNPYEYFRYYSLNPIPLMSTIDIFPGERIRGTIVYQMPLDSIPDNLIWKGYSPTEEINIQLGNQPVAVAPPEVIPGETTQTYNSIGDEIQVGDFIVVLNEILVDNEGDFYKPEPGYKFVFFAVTITNNSGELERGAWLSYIKDKTGYVFGTANRTISYPSNAACSEPYHSDVRMGTHCRYIGFEIPVDVTDFIFILDPEGSGIYKKDDLRFTVMPRQP